MNNREENNFVLFHKKTSANDYDKERTEERTASGMTQKAVIYSWILFSASKITQMLKSNHLRPAAA